MKNLITILFVLLSVVAFGQGRAVNQQVKIAEGTGSGADGYISNVSFVNNTVTYTGELNGFSGSIANFANTTFGNVFTQPQTVPYSVYGPSWNGSFYVPTMDALYDKFESLSFVHSDLSNLDYASSGHTGFAGTGVANTFTQAQTVPYVVYGVSWSGNNNVPTMAALYEKFEGLSNDHAVLTNLSYALSGHTGFAGTGVANTFSQPQTVPYSIYGPGWNGNYNVPTMDALYDKIESISDDHSGLSNLDYASAGHTGFAGTGVTNTFSLDQSVPFETYGVGWNGSAEVPTKNDVYDKIELLVGGASDGYISNVTESGNTITFTGVGSAFNGSIGTIAKTDQTNNFSATQYMGTSSSTRTEVGAAFLNFRETNNSSIRFKTNLNVEHASITMYNGTLLDIESDYNVKLRRGTREIRIESGGIEMDIDNTTGTHNVEIVESTGELVYTTKSAGTSYWQTSGGGIEPTSDAYELYIGGVADQGTYDVQMAGNLYIGGTSIQATNAYLLVDEVVSSIGCSGGVAEFTDANFNKVRLNAGSLPTATSGDGTIAVDASNDLWYIPATGSSEKLNIWSDDGTTVTLIEGETVTASNFILSSDRRYKRKIRTLTDTDWTNDLRFVSFRMKHDKTKTARYGLIAQEVEKVNPDMVTTDENGMKAVKYIDILIAKIAELEKRIEMLENEK